MPIVYGYPSVEMFEQADRGEIRLGGCVVGDESLDFTCPACGALLPWVRPGKEDRTSASLGFARRVVSWNMGRAMDSYADVHERAWHFLASLGADIALVQEVIRPTGSVSVSRCTL